MDYTTPHPLESLSFAEMKAFQKNLRNQISTQPYNKEPKIVAGVDLSYQKSKDEGLAVIVSFNYDTLEIIDVTHIVSRVTMPYQPGYLAFRELPVFINAWKKLKIEPDIVFFDGHGQIHPRRMGIATHASFFINKPTIGIGKSKFIGTFQEPENVVGSYNEVRDGDDLLGVIMKTKLNCKPVFISPGNGLTLEEAINFTRPFVTGKYRIPEVTRIADYYSKKLKE